MSLIVNKMIFSGLFLHEKSFDYFFNSQTMIYLLHNSAQVFSTGLFREKLPFLTPFLNMKSYLSRLFTGYSIERREGSGQKLLFKHRGKMVFFDPVLMIQEFHYRKSDSQQVYELQTTSGEVLGILPNLEPNHKPSVICEFEHGNRKWVVSRYSLNHENRPISHYRFEVDGNFLGALYRIYDNGNFMLNYSLKIASSQGTNISLSKEKNYWRSNSGEEVFIEKFGHTQIWVWTQPLSEKAISIF